MTYEYFVSYYWVSETQTGFGNASVTRDSPITSIEDTRGISKQLEQTKDTCGANRRLVVLSYQLFEKSDTAYTKTVTSLKFSKEDAHAENVRIGRLLHKLRKDRKLTLLDVKKATSIHRSRLSALENGNFTVQVYELMQLCAMYNVTPDLILTTKL